MTHLHTTFLRHRLTHKRRVPGAFACDLCGWTNVSRMGLAMHMKFNHGIDRNESKPNIETKHRWLKFLFLNYSYSYYCYIVISARTSESVAAASPTKLSNQATVIGPQPNNLRKKSWFCEPDSVALWQRLHILNGIIIIFL